MRISTAGKRRSSERGFTYVLVLAAVIVLGIVVEVTTVLSSQVKRAEQEAELLYRGMTYRNAIRSYYRVNGTYPRALEDLVRDNRHPDKHHLRALYPDPMTPPGAENGGWTLVRDSGGGIRGITSSSSVEPRKKANFPKGFEQFESATGYTQWLFEYVPETPVRPGVPAPGTKPPVGPPVRNTSGVLSPVVRA